MDVSQLELPVRNAGLYAALRSYVIAAFELLAADRESGDDMSFSVAEHRRLHDGARPFYEFRPLTEQFVLDRLPRIWELAQSDEAAWAVASDPACSAFMRAGRADAVAEMEVVARNEVLAPLLVSLAEQSPAFEFDEAVLVKQFVRFEKALYAEARRFVAAVPLHGVRLVSGDFELAPGVTIRAVDPVWFRMEWPEGAQLDWGPSGTEGLPAVILQFERQIRPDEDERSLDPLGSIVHVVSVIRALAGGSITAGPLVMERLDWRALAPRPVPAIAARRCGQLPSKIDGAVAKQLPRALRRLSKDPDGVLARSVERYQFAATAHGMGALRAVFDMLLEVYATEREVGSAALRLAVVLGASQPERRAFVDAFHQASRMIRSPETIAPDDLANVTKLLAAALRATVAAGLVGELPVSGLERYADGLIIGERDRQELGIATPGIA